MKRMKIVIVLVAIFVYSVSINARGPQTVTQRQIQQRRQQNLPVQPTTAAEQQKYAEYLAKVGIDDEEEEDEELVEYGPQEPLRVYAKRIFDEKYNNVQKELQKIRKRVFADEISVTNAIKEIKKDNEELVAMQKDFKKAIELEEKDSQEEESTGYLAAGIKDVFDKVKSVFVYSEEDKEIALWMIDQLEHQKKEYTTYYANLVRSPGTTTRKSIYSAIMQGLNDEINKQKVIAGKLWSTNQKYALSAAGALATLGTVGYLASGKKVEPKKGESKIESANQSGKEANVKPDDKVKVPAEDKQNSGGFFSRLFGTSKPGSVAEAKKVVEQKDEEAKIAKQNLAKKEIEENKKAEADKIAAEQKKLDDKIQSLKRQAEGELVKAKNATDPLIKSTAAEWAEIFTKQAKDIEDYSSLYNKFKIPGHKLTPEDRTRLAELTDAIRSY